MKVIDKETRSTWKFLDSARTLPDSLDNLGKCFGEDDTDLPASVFPLTYQFLKCEKYEDKSLL